MERALETVVERVVTAAVEEAGLALDGSPSCQADLSLDRVGRTASGTVACTGTTTAGLPVVATFEGSASVGGTCRGRLQVSVAGRGILDEELDVCSADAPQADRLRLPAGGCRGYWGCRGRGGSPYPSRQTCRMPGRSVSGDVGVDRRGLAPVEP